MTREFAALLHPLAVLLVVGSAATARAEKFYLLAGADARHYPGAQRNLFGPGGAPGAVYDGDRLAGTADIGPTVNYVGTGTPLYAPNYLGSLSFLFRRGTIPYAGGIPLLGIEFLGGPLLDLDGDPNGPRSLVPVPPYNVVEIPGTRSFVDLTPEAGQGHILLNDVDVTGCNEGGPNIPPGTATILVNIAGTEPAGSKTGPINPGLDTRLGTLTPYPGTSGTLEGVWQITGLGFEVWEDTVEPYSATASVLGTMQFLGTLRGWLVERSGSTGQFPVLTGEGLGSTRWPDFGSAHIGVTYNTANGLAGHDRARLAGRQLRRAGQRRPAADGLRRRPRGLSGPGGRAARATDGHALGVPRIGRLRDQQQRRPGVHGHDRLRRRADRGERRLRRAAPRRHEL
ncbi:MAG: hypothetical protein AB1716_09885 [Planctomycetota bacterium]